MTGGEDIRHQAMAATNIAQNNGGQGNKYQSAEAGAAPTHAQIKIKRQ